jgi:hypothetical protein
MLTQYTSIMQKSVLDLRVSIHDQINFNTAENCFKANLLYYTAQMLQ